MLFRKRESRYASDPESRRGRAVEEPARRSAALPPLMLIGLAFAFCIATVPLAGGWRSQAGQQVVPLKGAFGDGGQLTVRWQFKAQ